MAQATLTPGPGTVVQDALEPVLHNAVVTTTSNGAWVEVAFPEKVQAVVTLGVIDAGVTAFDILVQGADDAGGTNTVTYGRMGAITGASDGQTRQMPTNILKRYVRVGFVQAGAGNVNVYATLRPFNWKWNNTSTA